MCEHLIIFHISSDKITQESNKDSYSPLQGQAADIISSYILKKAKGIGKIEEEQEVGYNKSMWAITEDNCLYTTQTASISVLRHSCKQNKLFYTLERRLIFISNKKLESIVSYVQRLEI